MQIERAAFPGRLKGCRDFGRKHQLQQCEGLCALNSPRRSGWGRLLAFSHSSPRRKSARLSGTKPGS